MKKKVIYSVDIDTTNGDEIRDYEFTSYNEAKKIFNKYVKLTTYEEVPIENIQLVKIEKNGNWETLDCKFYDYV